MDSVLCERDIPNAGHQIPVSDTPDSAALRGIGCGKLLAGGLGFVLLTVGIFWYQFHRIRVGDQAPQWDQLQWRYFFLILLCLPLETVSSGLRIWLICRVLQSRVRPWACFKAEWANVAIAMLAPSQSGGGPGVVEAASLAIMEDIVPIGFVPYYTLLSRSLTLYLTSVAGLLCLAHALTQDARQAIRRVR